MQTTQQQSEIILLRNRNQSSRMIKLDASDARFKDLQ